MIFAQLDKREKHSNSSRNGSDGENQSNLQWKFREVGRQLFKTAKIATPPEKFHAYAEKLLAQDNKRLAGEGTKADEREKRIRKRRLRAKEEAGNRQEMNNC